MTGSIAARAAHAEFAGQAHQAQHDQHAGQQRRTRAVEAGAVLGVDLGGKSAKAQQHKRAEFGQDTERHQQHAAQQGGPQLRQHHPQKTAPRAAAQCTRGFFQRRVHAAQGGRHRQIHQGVISAGHHQQGAGEILQGQAQRHPAITGHKRRYRQRHHHQHGPRAPSRQLGTLDAPGRGRADQPGGQGGCNSDHQGVDQQLADQRTHQQLEGLAPTEGRRLHQRKTQRQQHQQRGGDAGREQHARRTPGGRRVRCAVQHRRVHYNKPAWRSSLTAWLSSPSFCISSSGGLNWSKGLSTASAAMPACSGYSKVTLLVASNCWARSLTR
jgi:hypothetical protein